MRSASYIQPRCPHAGNQPTPARILASRHQLPAWPTPSGLHVGGNSGRLAAYDSSASGLYQRYKARVVPGIHSRRPSYGSAARPPAGHSGTRRQPARSPPSSLWTYGPQANGKRGSLLDDPAASALWAHRAVSQVCASRARVRPQSGQHSALVRSGKATGSE